MGDDKPSNGYGTVAQELALARQNGSSAVLQARVQNGLQLVGLTEEALAQNTARYVELKKRDTAAYETALNDWKTEQAKTYREQKPWRQRVRDVYAVKGFRSLFSPIDLLLGRLVMYDAVREPTLLYSPLTRAAGTLVQVGKQYGDLLEITKQFGQGLEELQRQRHELPTAEEKLREQIADLEGKLGEYEQTITTETAFLQRVRQYNLLPPEERQALIEETHVKYDGLPIEDDAVRKNLVEDNTADLDHIVHVAQAARSEHGILRMRLNSNQRMQNNLVQSTERFWERYHLLRQSVAQIDNSYRELDAQVRADKVIADVDLAVIDVNAVCEDARRSVEELRQASEAVVALEREMQQTMLETLDRVIDDKRRMSETDYDDEQ